MRRRYPWITIGVLASILLLSMMAWRQIVGPGMPDEVPVAIVGKPRPDFAGADVPNFSFANQYGETVTEKTFAGKYYVADFFFTSCPTICPVMARHMATIQEAFAEDERVLLLSHSIDGKRDSVPVLRDYARRVGARPDKWHLVTGDRMDMYDLAREYYVTAGKQSDGSPLHDGKFIVVGPDGRLLGIYDGTSASSTRELIADLRDQL